MLNFMPIVYKQVKMVIIELRKPCVDVYPTKKETHHLELFSSQKDHKG